MYFKAICTINIGENGSFLAFSSIYTPFDFTFIIKKTGYFRIIIKIFIIRILSFSTCNIKSTRI